MRRILHFLIPVQMLLGKLPSMQLRQKYQMHSYDTLIEVNSKGYGPMCTLQIITLLLLHRQKYEIPPEVTKRNQVSLSPVLACLCRMTTNILAICFLH